MPGYSYTTEAGDLTVDRHYPAGSAPSKIRVNGRIYWRDFAPRYHRGKPGQGGVWQQSHSNGFVGDEKTLKQQMALDARLGVKIDYRKVSDNGKGAGTYVAEYQDARQKNNWLKAHKRVDFDAGYSAPCPGDFRGHCPPEFE